MTSSVFPETLQQKIDQWLAWDRNPKTRAEIEGLVAAGDTASLAAVLSHPMEFGTAGLRARMGAGFARMNDLTVIQAAQGLAAHITATFTAEDRKERGVVIGFDARHNSQRFARLSANVFLLAGIKTRLVRQICPTPYVPFGVRLYRCLAGVMVTASHNPKQDNGYKVYWDNGAQIVPPIDGDIARGIAAAQVPSAASWEEQPGVEDPFDAIEAAYFSTLDRQWAHQPLTAAAPFKYTYTAMHGVGTPFTVRALKSAGVPDASIVLVAEQVEPDPEFPTVDFPNPEEGKSALNLSFATADRNGSTIILANDPDADRLAVAEKLPTGQWKVFTGNELGALFGWWALQNYRLQNPTKTTDLAHVAMLSSAVSSAILRTMAAAEGFTFEATLTGFKYMGSRADVLERVEGKTVLFAFEEAIGFMVGGRVWDKDGVTAAGAFAEMCGWLHAHHAGRTPSQQLAAIYAQYGHHCSYNSYMVSPSPATTKAIFADVQRMGPEGAYPAAIAGAAVTRVLDLVRGYDSAAADQKSTLPCSTVSPMITFELANGVTLTIRGSGTEPKVKWYSESISKPGEASNAEQATKALHDFVDTAVCELMQPEKHKLTARKTG